MSPKTTPIAPTTKPAVALRCGAPDPRGRRTGEAVVSFMFSSPAVDTDVTGRAGRGLYARLLRRTMSRARATAPSPGAIRAPDSAFRRLALAPEGRAPYRARCP